MARGSRQVHAASALEQMLATDDRARPQWLVTPKPWGRGRLTDAGLRALLPTIFADLPLAPKEIQKMKGLWKGTRMLAQTGLYRGEITNHLDCRAFLLVRSDEHGYRLLGQIAESFDPDLDDPVLPTLLANANARLRAFTERRVPTVRLQWDADSGPEWLTLEAVEQAVMQASQRG